MAATNNPFNFRLLTPKSSQTACKIYKQISQIYKSVDDTKLGSECNRFTLTVEAVDLNAALSAIHNQLGFIVEEQFGNNFAFVFSMPGHPREVDTLGLTKVLMLFSEDEEAFQIDVYFKIHEVKKNRSFQPKLKILS